MPHGWASARIGELAGVGDVFCDGDWVESKDQDPTGDVRLVQLADVGDGAFLDRSHRFLTSAKAAELRCTYLEKGDVLIARMPDPLGRACVFPGDPKHAVTVVDVCIVRAHLVDLRWLMWFVNAPVFRTRVASLQSGSTRKRISRGNLATLDLPVPPLPEQHRIVAAIEQHLSRVDAGVAALERVKKELVRYRASVLKAACEGRLVPTEAALARAEGRSFEPASELLARILAERRALWEATDAKRPKKYPEFAKPDTAASPALPEGWIWTSIEALLCEPLRNGHSAKAVPQGGSTGIRTLTLTAVTRSDFSIENTKMTSANALRVANLWLQPGDILVQRSNTPDLVGTAAKFEGRSGFAVFPDLLIRVRTCKSVVSQFVLHVLRSQRSRRYFKLAAQGIAGSMPKIDQAVVAATPIPLPPLAEQHRIVAEVERRLSIADEVEATIKSALIRAARLRQSVLKRAFEGRLVPQDPNDEPASVLLARIRAERERAATDRKLNRRTRRGAKR